MITQNCAVLHHVLPLFLGVPLVTILAWSLSYRRVWLQLGFELQLEPMLCLVVAICNHINDQPVTFYVAVALCAVHMSCLVSLSATSCAFVSRSSFDT